MPKVLKIVARAIVVSAIVVFNNASSKSLVAYGQDSCHFSECLNQHIGVIRKNCRFVKHEDGLTRVGTAIDFNHDTNSLIYNQQFEGQGERGEIRILSSIEFEIPIEETETKLLSPVNADLSDVGLISMQCMEGADCIFATIYANETVHTKLDRAPLICGNQIDVASAIIDLRDRIAHSSTYN